MGIFSSAERLKCKFVATLNLKKHLPIHHRAPRRDKAEAANADVANGEEERNANGGGNALTRGGKSIRKKIRASFRMKSTRKGCMINTFLEKLSKKTSASFSETPAWPQGAGA